MNLVSISFFLIAALGGVAHAADPYESVFSRDFCARYLHDEATASMDLLGSEPKLSHYGPSEVTTLALRMARRNLIWTQTEAVNDDLTYFKDLLNEANDLFRISYRSRPDLSIVLRKRLATKACDRFLQTRIGFPGASVIVGYFPLINEFGYARLHLTVETLQAEIEIMNYMGRFFDAYTSVGDHSENYGARPIIGREQISIGHAFAVSSDEVFDFKKYLELVNERPRNRLVPALILTESDYEALEKLRKLSRNAEIPPPIANFIIEYQAFMQGLNLPPSSDIYPLVEALAAW